jgi:cobalt-zinc-cadmium efflux system membrane fusion protein
MKAVMIPRASLILALLCFAFAGCGAAIAQPKAGNSSSASGALEVVMAGKPTRKTLTLATTQPARIEALEQTPIYSRVTAYVGEVVVDYGDAVKKNQPLLKLSAPEMDADVAQKKALLEQSRAVLLQAEAGVKAAEAAIVTAQSKVVQAEAGRDRANTDLARWRSEFSRIGQLAASGAINQQIVDETQQKLGASEASLKEATAAIDATNAVVLQSQAEAARAASDVVAAKAQVQVSEANVARSEAERSYLTVNAPFDGIVTLRRVDPGHLVQPAGTPLLVVARIDKMRVFISVPESDAASVDLGDNVTIEAESLRGAPLKGKVTRTGYALDVSSRSLDTIIDVDNADDRLRPGQYAMARIILKEQADVLTLPSAAVVRQGNDAHCYRLIGGKATKTPIQLGIKVSDDFEVVKGVSDSDTVILNKAAALKDGQSVEVSKSAAK